LSVRVGLEGERREGGGRGREAGESDGGSSVVERLRRWEPLFLFLCFILKFPENDATMVEASVVVVVVA